MNKGLYKHVDKRCIYFYKKWKNSAENSGSTIRVWCPPSEVDIWNWNNCEDDEDDYGLLVGSTCLVQW